MGKYEKKEMLSTQQMDVQEQEARWIEEQLAEQEGRPTSREVEEILRQQEGEWWENPDAVAEELEQQEVPDFQSLEDGLEVWRDEPCDWIAFS